MTNIFSETVDDDGIATVTWDLPGASMNVLNEAGILELEALMPRLLADSAVKGVILTSGKKDFAGGMDLPTILSYKNAALESDDPAGMLFSFVMRLHDLLRLIERGGADPKTGKGGKPLVWAAPGTGVGIGTELALACHRRIAADNPGARFGLPEVKIGIFPGSGGTTRLIRMLGLMGASEFLLKGKTLPPKAAERAGLIDEVVAAEDLLAAAKRWLLQAGEADAVKPWDRKGFKIPGGAPYTSAGFPIFVGASALAQGSTQGAYPAVNAMLSAIYEGAQLDFDDAIRVEARWFTKVLLDPSSAAMIRTLFINKQRLEKGAGRPAGVAPAPLRRLGVIGAGMMGAGIAGVAAGAGIEVVLLDRDDETAVRGAGLIAAGLNKSVQRKRLLPGMRDQIMERVSTGSDFGQLSGCDLVIEAVFEDPDLKRGILAQAEAALAPGAILASNTSTLSIGGLAQACTRPRDFLGIHFFSPVDRMLLVEIIQGPATGEAAIARAFDLVRQLKKTPILVNDAPYFYANRCIMPYGREGIRMVAEGVAPALAENAARQLGMPVGPLQLTDETSLELALQISIAQGELHDGQKAPDPAMALVRTMVQSEGRRGRKSGGGFYSYDDAGKRTGLWDGLAGLAPELASQPGLAEVKDRLLLAQVLEACRAHEAGVIRDIQSADVGAVLGWGFAPWSGGPFSWIDMTGPGAVVARANTLADRFGERFAPPQLLLDLATSEGSAYGALSEPEAA